MKTSTYCIIGSILFLFFECSSSIHLHDFWSKKDYHKANTARFALYMSKKSRESIRFVNMARMNGSLFAKTYYLDYLLKNEIIKSIDDSSFLYRPYYGSLYTGLLKSHSLPLLKPSFSLNLSAGFHALTSGISGYVGHDKPLPCNVRFKVFGNFNSTIGENCDYGNRFAVDAVMSLLIDESVPNLGHRKNILSKNYRRVGCSFMRHKKYEFNYVQDFSSGNLWERIFK